jgi:hypothetical protein
VVVAVSCDFNDQLVDAPTAECIEPPAGCMEPVVYQCGDDSCGINLAFVCSR